MLIIVMTILYGIIIICGSYHWLMALASIKEIPEGTQPSEYLKFAVVITAYNEAGVIRSTLEKIYALDYPSDHFEVFVAADNCTDDTAHIARSVGTVCFDKEDGGPIGKGPVLNWLIDRIFEQDEEFDAFVVFDADTVVDKKFLGIMNARLQGGAQVVQGKHTISNPTASWYTALACALMIIDNRFSNQGRQNLNLSAKNMGDSICVRTEVLKTHPWGSGLTEDYDYRLHLLMDSILIEYEPQAVGYGQAPVSWAVARNQRLRWLKGFTETGRKYRRKLFSAALDNKNLAQFDGALGTVVPSYSTLALITLLAFLFSLFIRSQVISMVRTLGSVLLLFWFLYPIFGLTLERAPLKFYLAILTGPFFMVWRSWLRIRLYFLGEGITWIRTDHHGVDG